MITIIVDIFKLTSLLTFLLKKKHLLKKFWRYWIEIQTSKNYFKSENLIEEAGWLPTPPCELWRHRVVSDNFDTACLLRTPGPKWITGIDWWATKTNWFFFLTKKFYSIQGRVLHPFNKLIKTNRMIERPLQIFWGYSNFLVIFLDKVFKAISINLSNIIYSVQM